VSKSSRVARQRAQEVITAQRRAKARRRRVMVASGSVAAILVVVSAFVVVRLVGGSARSGQQSENAAQTAAVASAVTSVPAAVLDKIGLGSVTSDSLPKPLSGQQALTSNGRPLIVYLGAEYCPFCAAQRWGVVVALSRFGRFSNLATAHSGADDVYPNTATLSFHGSSYTSLYLEFQGVEMQSSERQGQSYRTLDTPTPLQRALLEKYDAPPFVPAQSAGAIPFVDFANTYLMDGASFSPQVLTGMTALDIATALSNSESAAAQAIGGSANAFSALFCQLTDGQPAAVCTSAGVTAARSWLGAS
jgi:Domain of unknown function (DUF929)